MWDASVKSFCYTWPANRGSTAYKKEPGGEWKLSRMCWGDSTLVSYSSSDSNRLIWQWKFAIGMKVALINWWLMMVSWHHHIFDGQQIISLMDFLNFQAAEPTRLGTSECEANGRNEIEGVERQRYSTFQCFFHCCWLMVIENINLNHYYFIIADHYWPLLACYQPNFEPYSEPFQQNHDASGGCVFCP